MRAAKAMEPVAIQQHIEELDTGIQTDAAQEQGKAEFTKHEVCAVGHKEVQRANLTLSAKYDGNNEGAAGETQLERGRHPWESDWNAAHNDSQEDAKERGQYFWMIQCC